MKLHPRPAAFVLAASDYGPIILNRFDHHQLPGGEMIGIGHHVLATGACDPDEIAAEVGLLELARAFRGAGVVALDGGANIGLHSVAWARAMTGWGTLTAFEAQERLFYALAGNLALNNCGNAKARLAALGETCGSMRIPLPDYERPSSFGSLELRPRPDNEYIGQAIDYAEAATEERACVSIDSLALPRLDFVKLDVEGMELEVLRGAGATLARCRPMLVVEALKGDRNVLQHWLETAGYAVWAMGANFVAVHQTDPAREHIRPSAP